MVEKEKERRRERGGKRRGKRRRGKGKVMERRRGAGRKLFYNNLLYERFWACLILLPQFKIFLF